MQQPASREPRTTQQALDLELSKVYLSLASTCIGVATVLQNTGLAEDDAKGLLAMASEYQDVSNRYMETATND